MNKIISFYSYKGGAGRTTTMANVAVLMANQGYSVACIDLDLNAPGIDKAFEIKKPPQNSIIQWFRGVTILPLKSMYVVYDKIDCKLNGKVLIFPAVRFPEIDNRQGIPDISIKKIQSLAKRILDETKVDYIFLDAKSGYGPESTIHFVLPQLLFVTTRYSQQHMAGTQSILTMLGKFAELKKDYLKYVLIINDIPNDIPSNVRSSLNKTQKKDNAILIAENRRLRWKDSIIIGHESCDEQLMNSYKTIVKTITGGEKSLNV
jgi:MinD-like ATPase involved in chromosome partitioning or flagellar assembly